MKALSRNDNDTKIGFKDLLEILRTIPLLLFIPIMGIGIFILDKLFKKFPEPYEDLDEQVRIANE